MLEQLRLSLLHLAPMTGAVAANRRLIEQGVRLAAAQGADWVLTPELAVCGYEFREVIGTAWIRPQPDAWMVTFCELVKTLGVTVFLSHPERDSPSSKLYNSVFVISPHGETAARHRKIHCSTGPKLGQARDTRLPRWRATGYEWAASCAPTPSRRQWPEASRLEALRSWSPPPHGGRDLMSRRANGRRVPWRPDSH